MHALSARAARTRRRRARLVMLNRQRMHAVEYTINRLDEEIVELFADGYMVDVDRRLDDRLAQQRRREQLQRGEVPNG